jgi:hypothetical protein
MAEQLPTRLPRARCRLVACLGCALGIGFGTPPARADDPPPPAERAPLGLYLQARTLGFAVPYGNATGALGDTLGARHDVLFLPIGIDVGVRLADELHLVAKFTYTMGGEGSGADSYRPCNNDYVECSSSMLRAGLGAEAHFVRDSVADPWLGLAFGMTRDAASYHDSHAPRSESNWSIGYEMLVSGGLLFWPGSHLAVGPFVDGSIGRYVYSSTEVDGQATAAGAIDHQANHGWLSAGLQVVLAP